MVSVDAAVSIVGTYAGLVAALSITAHVAARNVLGDVPAARAPLVAAVPAALPFLLQRLFPPLTVALALAVDAAAFRLVYRLPWRTAGAVTFVHAVVTVIAGAVVGFALALVSTMPG